MSRVPRVFCPDLPAAGETASLDDRASRHLVRALRLRPGAPLRLFDGRGREHAAALTRADPGAATAVVGDPVRAAPESPLHVSLLQGVGRGERMDLVVQKATELGVSSLVPVLTARSVVRLSGARAERRVAHWTAVAVSACEQCGRATLPAVSPPRSLGGALAGIDDDAIRLLPDPTADAALAAHPAPTGPLVLLIGPEGGLDDDERRAALAAGFRPVRMGPRVLRTETAAIAALALVQGLWGDLAGG